jgi:hypothetical protein
MTNIHLRDFSVPLHKHLGLGMPCLVQEIYKRRIYNLL